MVVVCLVIGVAFYIALEAINFFRLQYYRSALITGPVQLIADLTASQPEDYREHDDPPDLLGLYWENVSRDQAMTMRSRPCGPSHSTTAYSSEGLSATAWLAGRVHGVVVQITTERGPSPQPSGV